MGGRLVSPFQTLQDGEVVQVLTDQNQTPSPQWLNHVRTTRAQVAIRRFLNSQAHQRAQELGRALFAAEAKRLKADALNSPGGRYVVALQTAKMFDNISSAVMTGRGTSTPRSDHVPELR